VERQNIEIRADPHLLGSLGEQRLKDRQRGTVPVAGEEVLLHRQIVEAHRLGLLEQPHPILPELGLGLVLGIAEVHGEADVHGVSSIWR
jgi:hypothetical protein